MSTDRTPDESNSDQQSVTGSPDVHHAGFGAKMSTNNQSHDDEGSSYGSVDWYGPDSDTQVESIPSDDHHSPSGAASARDETAQGPSSSAASSEEEFAMRDKETHTVPVASVETGTLQFARPDPGFDAADDQFVKDHYRAAGNTHHVLGYLRQPGPTMSERYLESINDLQRATGRAPTEQERAFIDKTLRKNTGWLEGYKATLEGQTAVPMAAFNRLAQDYEEVILYVARDRSAYEADAMVSIFSREDQIKTLQRELAAIRPQEASQREKDLKSELSALNGEIGQLRTQESRCNSLQAEVAELKQQAEEGHRAAIVATERTLRRAYNRRITALEEQLRKSEMQRERHSLKRTALDAFADEVTKPQQENAELKDILAECEDPRGNGRANDAEHDIPDEEEEEDTLTTSDTDVEVEVDAAPYTRSQSTGYLLLKNAFADSQRLRAANKELEILKDNLEQEREDRKDLQAYNADLAPRYNRVLRRLSARNDEIAFLKAQLAEAELRAARNLVATSGERPKRTINEELLKQWNDAKERNNRQILTALSDQEDMVATWKEDVHKMFEGYKNGQLPEDAGTFSFDRMLPL